MTAKHNGEDLASFGLMSRGAYVQAIRPLLPAEAFQTCPGKLWGVAIHSVLFFAGIVAIAHVEVWWLRLLLGIAVGHSLACLAFFGHDLSHSSVVRSRSIKYALEVWVWGLRLMPATVWRRLHNQVHHANSNTPNDTDRHCFPSELNWWMRALGYTFTPFKNPVRWSPLVLLAFVAYTLGNTVTAFLPGRNWRHNGPYRVAFLAKQRLRILFEVLMIVVFQLGIFALAGFDLATYAWCYLPALAVSSGLTMMYIFTNHYLNIITEVEDPLLGTTSVAVPKAIDWLHAHFSYHTEHHLFPSLNSSYYPLVCRLLMEKFPDRYNRIGLGAAWRQLWHMPFDGEVVQATLLTNTGHPSRSVAKMRNTDAPLSVEECAVEPTAIH
ncbi:MAG: fatty acid desaturase [Gemmataceae bacterium]|nr:fatty acid desaturase [Gemmataceae bacterium]